MTIRAVTWDDARQLMARSRVGLFGAPTGLGAQIQAGGTGMPTGFTAVVTGNTVSAGGGTVGLSPGNLVRRAPTSGAPTATVGGPGVAGVSPSGAGSGGQTGGTVGAVGGVVAAPSGSADKWGPVPPGQPLALFFMALNVLRDAGVDPFRTNGWPGLGVNGYTQFALGPGAHRFACRAGQPTQVGVAFTGGESVCPVFQQAIPFTANEAGVGSMSPKASWISWSADKSDLRRPITFDTARGWYLEVLAAL